MRKLKIVLQSNYFYLISFVFISLFILIKTVIIKYESKYNNESSITGIIQNINIFEDKVRITLKTKETILCTYYNTDINISIGDEVELIGTMNTPSNNTIPNTFNYKKYLYNNKIYKTFTISNLKIINNSNNIFYKLKDIVIKRCTNSYIKLFVIGDKSLLDTDTYNNYKDIGVAHLLAVSGMHVGVFILILNKILFFIPKKKREVLISLFLLFYSYLVSFSASILRVVIFYIIGRLNIKISNLKRLYLTALIMLIINPFYLYNTAFQYSFITVTGIILTSKYYSKNHFKNLILVSIYSLLFTLPITVNLNYEINLISIISNLILIPFVTFIIYPLSLITFIFPKFIIIYEKITSIMEIIVNIINKVDIFKINIPKLNIIVIIIYYLLLIYLIHFNKRRYIIILIIIILVNKYIPLLDNNYHVIYLDVGQGDSSLIIYPHHKRVILIDTGGNSYYNVSSNTIIYLKSIGINKIDYLFITHGDNDHMGDAIYLTNNIKVKQIFINKGEINELEQSLLNTSNNINKLTNSIKIGDITYNLLDTGIYNNENDNSIVLLFNINNISLLFMGDASVDRELDILNKYNLKQVDILKVGHHGSDTSTSKIFINKIKPINSIISVGKNNRYGHPKDSVLENLTNSNILRTDIDGSIEVKINENGYKFRTCSP